MTESNEWLKEAQDPKTSPERLRAIVAEHASVRALVAKNPSAPPEVLREIYDKGQVFHYALVKNPNTPPDLLLRLASEYPEEFLENPALSLFLIESPDFFERLPVPFFTFFLERKEAPEIILELGTHSANSEIRLMVAAYPGATPEQLCILAKDEQTMVVRHVAAHLHTPPEVLLSLLDASDEETVFGAAQNPSTPIERLNFFYSLGFADHPSLCHLPDRALSEQEKEAILQLGPVFRRVVAQAKDTPPWLIERLSEDKDPTVRAALGCRDGLPLHLLEKLVDDPDVLVLQSLNSRARPPDEICIRLAQITRGNIYIGLARRPQLSEGLWSYFTEKLHTFWRQIEVEERLPSLEEYDSFLELGYTLVQRRDATPEILGWLSVFPEDVWRGPDEEGLMKTDEEIRYTANRHRNAPEEIVENNANSSSRSERLRTANNPKTPLHLLESLATDSSEEVRLAVLSHPNVSLLIVELLCEDPCVRVASLAKARLRDLAR